MEGGRGSPNIKKRLIAMPVTEQAANKTPITDTVIDKHDVPPDIFFSFT